MKLCPRNLASRSSASSPSMGLTRRPAVQRKHDGPPLPACSLILLRKKLQTDECRWYLPGQQWKNNSDAKSGCVADETGFASVCRDGLEKLPSRAIRNVQLFVEDLDY